ncbi:hypothetical protein CSAL01_00381 [Colletotrichum salicis]|uniref:Sulfatase-modifying factor enzyme-like domain-containing protein n=1 Tax=Colletotrichum salicis TaxID=1209931 RepID=A0A135SFV7_9PEZI|nr:hypothetical protein CSAL01_00381 [Colletotrichum salicis]
MTLLTSRKSAGIPINFLLVIFALDGTEVFKTLAEVTIPELLSASDSRHEGLLIILDDLQNAGNELTSILAQVLLLLPERSDIKLLLLGDADVLDSWSCPAKVVRHDLLPLLEPQRRETSTALVDGLPGGKPASSQRAALLVAGLIPLSAEVESKVKSFILEIIENGALSAGEREKAGRLLSRYGDPRDLTGLAVVPAGSFLIGSESHPNSQPLHRISLERFRIGFYTVANRDYHVFVRDTGRDWMSPDGADPEVKYPSNRPYMA